MSIYRIINYLLLSLLLIGISMPVSPAVRSAARAPSGLQQNANNLKERIEFAVKWSFVPLLDTYMETFILPGENDGAPLYLLTHQAAKNAFWNDRMESLIDSESFLPRQMETIIKDGLKERIIFERQIRKARLLKPDAKRNQAVEETIDISSQSMDPLSAFYYMRMHLSPLNPQLELKGITGPRRFRLHGKLTGQVRLKVPAGNFVAYRLECNLSSWMRKVPGKQMEGNGGRIENNPFTLWVTADAHRFPIQIRYRLALGSLWVRAKSLQSHDQPG